MKILWLVLRFLVYVFLLKMVHYEIHGWWTVGTIAMIILFRELDSVITLLTGRILKLHGLQIKSIVKFIEDVRELADLKEK